MSSRQNSNRDKRFSKLSRESEKLRREITELEDALILHSRYREEDDSSLNGMIRREVGGSRWEHGAEGKLQTYRGNKDLTERGGRSKQKYRKEQDAMIHSQRQEIENPMSSALKSSNSKRHQEQRTSGVSTGSAAKNERNAADKSCLNGDWALRTKKTSKEIPVGKKKESSSGMDALKSKVLAKASAKVIKRKDFAPLSENKSNHSLKEDISSKEDNLKNSVYKKSKEREKSDKNNQNNDISYSLSFIERLQESETRDSKFENTQKDFPKLPSEFDGEGSSSDRVDKNIVVDNLNSENSSTHINTCSSRSERWAVERNDTNVNITQPVNSRTQRRNSVGGACEQTANDDSSKVVPRNRMSQPLGETDRQFGKKENSNETRCADFPLLFGSVHKTLDVHSQPVGGNSRVSLLDECSTDNTEAGSGPNDGSSSTGSSSPTKYERSLPPSKQSIIICDEEVQSWLENLGLQDVDSYVSLFSDHQMDIGSVRLLTAGRLRQMGIHALGPIMKIIKGVQVLNRDSSLREDVCKENDVVEDKMKGFENETSNDIEQKGDKKQNEKDNMKRNEKDDKKQSKNGVYNKGAVGLNERGIEASPRQKSATTHPMSLSWKKTADDAEYVNLSDRSPVEEDKAPTAVCVKEKSEKDRKSAALLPKSGQKKTKSPTKADKRVKPETQPSPKVMKKPPAKEKDGISLAQEKYLEKRKQEDSKTRSDQISSARQRQLRDKMAARHTSRRSSSLERKPMSSRSQQTSLNRTFSETQTQEDEIIPLSGAALDVEELLKTKPLGVGDHCRTTTPDKESKTRTGVEVEEMAVCGLLDAKNIDQAVEKLTDTKESLNLSIVRQLKKQLHHIEQHLVQNMEQPAEENDSPGRSSPEGMDPQHRKNITRDSNVRTSSARERRRQRTPKQFPTTLEGNCDATQDFFKVGGILSHRKPKDGNEGFVGDCEITRATTTSAQTSPHVSPKSADDTSRSVNKEEIQDLSQRVTENNTRPRWGESSPNRDRPSVNVESQILDNIHSSRATRQSELSRGKLAMAQEYLRKIEIDKRDISFQMEDLLGDGAFSQVYKGVYQGSEVAVKQLKTSLTPNDKNYFSAEVSLLQELRHPHVVMLLGVCTAFPCPVLVLEYMQGGNLHTRIHDNKQPPFAQDEFCLISRDVASGICYLHHHRPPVLHLDLKSRNVLLGLGNRAKVADFGFSKWKVESDLQASRSSKSQISQVSPAWMAPELLAAGEITPKADVYSFALVLWEMLTREDPYKGCSTFQIVERVRRCQRPAIPRDCPERLGKLVERCWEQNPCTRPTFKEILPDLDKVSNSEEWMKDLQEKTSIVDGIVFGKSQQSLEVVEDNVAGRNEVTASRTPRNVSVEKRDSPRFGDHHESSELYERNQKHIESAEKGIVIKMEDSQLLLEHCTNDESAKEIRESEGKMYGNTSRNMTSTSDVFPSSFKSASPRVSTLRETETLGNVNPDTEVADSDEKDPSDDALVVTKTKQSVAISDISPRTLQSEKPSTTTQLLLDSARDSKKLDELLHKYLPSPSPRSRDLPSPSPRSQDIPSPSPRPRDSTRKVSPVSNSGRKLLPLRQSLDKPRKPPKPQIINRGPVSRSENVGVVSGTHGDVSLSDKEVEKITAMESLDGDTSYTLPGRQSDQCEKSSLGFTVGQTKEQTTDRCDTSPTSISNPNLQAAILDASSDDLNVLEQQRDPGTSYEPPEDVKKTAEVSSSSRNFSDITREIEQTLSSLQNVSKSPPSSGRSLQSMNIDEVISALQENDSVPDSKTRASFQDESVRPHNSWSKTDYDTQLTRLNLDDCRSSIATNMSADSLSLSLSDEADSVDFSERGPKRSSHKLGKSSTHHKSPGMLPPHHSADKNVLFAPSAKRNASRGIDTKSRGNVRESFFLFDDFHLDLNKLSDSDSETEGRNHVDVQPKPVNNMKSKNKDESKSHPASLSPIGKQHHKVKHSQSLQHHQHHQSREMKTSHNGDVRTHSSTNQIHPNHPRGSHVMNPTLKESILLGKQQLTDKNKPTTLTNTIPPPPPPFLTSHQIKRSPKDHHATPVKSGVPSKSASTKPEVVGHSRFSVQPDLLLQQRNKLRSVIPEDLTTPLKEMPHGRSMPSVASILKKAMDDRRLAMGDNQESQEGMTTPEASWSIQD